MADIEKRDDLRRPPFSDDHVRLRSRRRSPESRPASRRFTEVNERSRGSDAAAFSGRPTAKEHTELRPSDRRAAVSEDRRERNDSDYRSRSRREDDDERQERRNRVRDDPALPSISAHDDRRSRDRWPRDRDTSYRTSERYTGGRQWEGKSGGGGMSEEGEFKRPRQEGSQREQRGSEGRGEGRRSESGIVPWMDEPQVDRRVAPRGEWGAKGGGSGDGFGGKWGHDMFHEVNRSPEKKVEELSIERIEALLAA